MSAVNVFKKHIPYDSTYSKIFLRYDPIQKTCQFRIFGYTYLTVLLPRLTAYLPFSGSSNVYQMVSGKSYSTGPHRLPYDFKPDRKSGAFPSGMAIYILKTQPMSTGDPFDMGAWLIYVGSNTPWAVPVYHAGHYVKTLYFGLPTRAYDIEIEAPEKPPNPPPPAASNYPVALMQCTDGAVLLSDPPAKANAQGLTHSAGINYLIF